MDIRETKDPSLSFPSDEAFIEAVQHCPDFFCEESRALAAQLSGELAARATLAPVPSEENAA